MGLTVSVVSPSVKKPNYSHKVPINVVETKVSGAETKPLHMNRKRATFPLEIPAYVIGNQL